MSDPIGDAKLRRAIEQARVSRLKLINQLSDPFERREYYLTGIITPAVASELIGTMDQWRRIDAANPESKRVFRLIINSISGDGAGNGSFIAALSIYEFLRFLKLRGFTVEVQILGHASFHAAMIVQGASDGRRFAGPRSYMFLRELQTEFQDSTLGAEHRIRWIRGLQEQYNRIMSSRCDLDAGEFASRIERQLWCLNGKEARRVGLIDDIIDGPMSDEVGCVVPPAIYEAEDSAEDRQQKAERVRNECDALMMHLDALKRETEDSEAAVHRLFTGVDPDSCKSAMQSLRRFGTRCNRHMTLLINSPGGRIVDGLGVYDTIAALQGAGHRVDTVCLGYAASMGGVLLQAGNERIIGAESWILIHRASSWFGGTTTEILDNMDRLDRLQDECFRILSSKSGKKLTMSDVRKRCDRGDWWIRGSQAKRLGLVDTVF